MHNWITKIRRRFNLLTRGERYEEEKQTATKNIAGNFMSHSELEQQSRASDQSLASMRKEFRLWD